MPTTVTPLTSTTATNTQPDPSPLTSQPVGTTNSIIQPQPSPLTVQPDSTDHTPDAASSTGQLESKYIFGIIVGGILLTVLILVAVVVIAFLLITIARRRNRRQFVETFVETAENEAYHTRRTALHTRSNGQTQHFRAALNSHPIENTIETMSNRAYLTSSETSVVEANTTTEHVNPVSGTHNADLNRTIEMQVNESYHTKVGTIGHELPDTKEVSVRMHEVSVLAGGSGTGTQDNRGQSSPQQLVKPYEIIKLPGVEKVKDR